MLCNFRSRSISGASSCLSTSPLSSPRVSLPSILKHLFHSESGCVEFYSQLVWPLSIDNALMGISWHMPHLFDLQHEYSIDCIMQGSSTGGGYSAGIVKYINATVGNHSTVWG